MFQKRHLDAWGHTLSVLLENSPPGGRPSADLIDAAKELDKHHIPTRYPNGFEGGAAVDFYTRREAELAIANAEMILEWCRRQRPELPAELVRELLREICCMWPAAVRTAI